jgi:hypothetical protein
MTMLPAASMKRHIVILVCSIIALVMGLVIAQPMLRPTVVEAGPARPISKTTGVVKSFRAAPLISSSPLQRAVVKLADGSEVEASVLPGCVVQSGETVHVHVFGSASSQHVYVVAGAV